MASTSAFGWETPDDTDLVKDGAAAIRTLGNSIDTSMADLKGGTSGQVLSKASNTDMDFTWVAQDDSNAIQNAIVDAKGDLIAATANDTPARLAVGNNGETLVADSSTATGLRYNPPVGSLANPIINGGFDIWQRGTSFSYAASTSALNYNADRWQGGTGVNQATTISRQPVGDTVNLPNLQYCLRWQRNSGQTGTGGMAPSTSIETANSIPFSGKTVTVSFYARAGANYSASGNGLTAVLVYGTGTDQNVQNGMTGQTTIGSTSATLTTTWQRFAFTANVPAASTQLAAYFLFTPTGTAGAADYFEATGLQIDVGTYTASTAPTFRRSGGTIQGELAACQRYFQVIAEGNSAYIFNGNNWYAFDVRGVYTFPVQMRTAPTLVGTTGTNYYRVQYNTTTDDLNEIKMSSATVRNCLLLNDTQAAVTAGTPATVLTNNASASVAISAEL